jgi:hypothetical protein
MAAALALCPALAEAQAASSADARPSPGRASSAMTFLGGAALAFGLHETGHLIWDIAFDAHPGVRKVTYGPIPFFAIVHRGDLSPRREFTVSSAGFWVQEATDDWLLTARPGLRDERAPFAKGMLAFNILTSIGYSIVAMTRSGPYERDTRGMAQAIGLDERTIGLVVLAPAVLDAYRYYRPESRWARWASRAVKVGGVMLILK